MKPGYKTTEFYMSIVGQIVGFALMSGIFDCAPEMQCSGTVIMLGRMLGLVALLLTNLGYTVPRSLSKGKVSASIAEIASTMSVANPTKP